MTRETTFSTSTLYQLSRDISLVQTHLYSKLNRPLIVLIRTIKNKKCLFVIIDYLMLVNFLMDKGPHGGCFCNVSKPNADHQPYCHSPYQYRLYRLVEGKIMFSYLRSKVRHYPLV